MTGIYISLDEATLQQMRADVLAQLQAARTGKRFLSVGGSGKSFTKDNMTIPQLKEELAEINYALSKLDPEKYGKRASFVRLDFRNLLSQ